MRQGDGKELASRLWNVSATSTLDYAMCDSRNEFVVSFGEGIAGNVAASRTPMNIANVYEVRTRIASNSPLRVPCGVRAG